MKYQKLSERDKKRIVAMVVDEGNGLREASRKSGINPSTIATWLRDPMLNENAEYARMLKERGMTRKPCERKPKDPFPEGVPVASRTSPDELAKENRDLRKKAAYLEDKVAYLEKLYELIDISSDKTAKKKRFEAIQILVREGRGNVRRLCTIAGVSAKCFYAHEKGPSQKVLSDEQAISFIRELQESYGNSLGYRKMADRLKDGYGVELGRKKVLS